MSKTPVCRWDFTASCDKVNKEELVIYLKKLCKQYVFQKEKGEKTDYEHWQGRVSLKVKNRKVPLEYCVEWSPTSNANMDNDFYVMKEETRIDGPFSDKDECHYVPRQFRECPDWLPWQAEVVRLSQIWDTRHIDVIVDRVGDIGKSILVGKMCCELRYARAVPPLSNYKELMNLVFCMPVAKCYLVDMPKAMDKEKQNEFFSAIEDIKNGHIWDNRYTFKEKWIDSPNIWLFTNVPPNRRLLSKDRWRMWEIDSEGDLRALRCNTSS